MKRRAVLLQVSDHAVLCYLERQHGLDVAAVRSHLAGMAQGAAELGAIAIQIEKVKLVIRSNGSGQATVVTALSRTGRVSHIGGEG
ncbi:hypothetical protein [Afifella pfennigii]|uniref:hypothetical protein n=1 Tax=Afifella pfennigii TaxID=209897 RepID=UPI00047B3962|nr:hypothetical protein [Afifella pfennigii]